MAAEENNKINEIVALLKRDGVEAGESEANKIIEEAEKKASEILNHAKTEKDKYIEEAKEEAEKHQRSAEANIRMAIKQGLNQFKESIEKDLLKPTILETLNKNMNGETIKEVIINIVDAYAKAGFKTNELTVILDKEEGEKIKDTLLTEIKTKVKNSSGIEISDEKIPKGVKLVSKGSNLSLEFTPETMTEVLLSFVRPEFRKIFFEGK